MPAALTSRTLRVSICSLSAEVKANFALEQAIKTERGSRGITLLFL
jgi:hypothetical protein